MKQCGLSKKERLKSPFEFKSVYQRKRVVKSSLFWLYRMPNGLEFNRIGISVSNKFCANIVQRNKIKRIIRRVFQCNKKCFGKGVDVVLVLKRRPESVSYEDFEKILLGLAKR